MRTGEQGDLLSRLANKAKRKLNKTNEEETQSRSKLGIYEFSKSQRSDAQKKLEKKIENLLKNHPDCIDPIGRLIDHSVYDCMSPEKKQAYILKLSNDYKEISEKFR